MQTTSLVLTVSTISGIGGGVSLIALLCIGLRILRRRKQRRALTGRSRSSSGLSRQRSSGRFAVRRGSQRTIATPVQPGLSVLTSHAQLSPGSKTSPAKTSPSSAGLSPLDLKRSLSLSGKSLRRAVCEISPDIAAKAEAERASARLSASTVTHRSFARTNTAPLRGAAKGRAAETDATAAEDDEDDGGSFGRALQAWRTVAAASSGFAPEDEDLAYGGTLRRVDSMAANARARAATSSCESPLVTSAAKSSCGEGGTEGPTQPQQQLGLTQEIQELKTEAVRLKKAGDVQGALASLKEAKQLEAVKSA